MAEHCPTCGATVRTVNGDEGTSHYKPAGEIHYRAGLEAARDALADPNALAEAIDSPANQAFAIINHALAALPRGSS